MEGLKKKSLYYSIKSFYEKNKKYSHKFNYCKKMHIKLILNILFILVAIYDETFPHIS